MKLSTAVREGRIILSGGLYYFPKRQLGNKKIWGASREHEVREDPSNEGLEMEQRVVEKVSLYEDQLKALQNDVQQMFGTGSSSSGPILSLTSGNDDMKAATEAMDDE